jgi:sugar phosphate isomerase/epimerase
MTRRLSLAHLTAVHMDPPALIRAAAEAGFDAVGLRLLRVTEDSPGYPLMDDPAAMRATKSALSETGIEVSDIEFIRITPEIDIPTLMPFLDAGAALSARHVITAPYDDDLNRLSDRLGQLSEAAEDRGLTAVLEFFPWTPVADLQTCLQVVNQAGASTGILVDSLHMDRCRSSFEELRDIPAERLPFAHLCDAPVLPSYSYEQLIHNARTERFAPGEGEIDLRRFLAALPDTIPLGIEVPTPDPAFRDDPVKVLRHLIDATRVLIG